MDSAANFTDTRHMFTRLSDVGAYAKRYGRRELEVALTSGMLSPQSEQLIADWLLRDEARQQRWQHWPFWASGVIALVLVMAAIGKIF